ncbi:MAG: hypothetical protein LIR50_06035 [Bacillota bacterium]|nr:hypothetical protein [Bacillota bacterium]
MYVITNKEDNKLINMGEKLDYLENGYPRLINEKVAFPTGLVNVYEVGEIPEGVEAEKYCYTAEDGFYRNENYVKYYSTEERLENIEAMLDLIAMGGLE